MPTQLEKKEDDFCRPACNPRSRKTRTSEFARRGECAVDDVYLNPLRSTEASELNLIIMKFDADTNILLLKSIFPESVARLTALSSVRPPTSI